MPPLVAAQQCWQRKHEVDYNPGKVNLLGSGNFWYRNIGSLYSGNTSLNPPTEIT